LRPPVDLRKILWSLQRLGSRRTGGSRSHVSLLLPINFLAPHEPPDPGDRIVKGSGNALLQGNDGVIGDVDVFRADLSTALGNVAQADAKGVLEFTQAVGRVQRVHRQGSNAHHEARPGKVVSPVIPQDMTDVLAQEAFNALVEFL